MMNKLKINFRVVVALLVIVGAIYFAFTAVQTEAYAGDSLDITTSGVINLTNTSDEPAMLSATSSRTFRITVTGDENTPLRSERIGSGRDAVNVIETELPSGQSVVTVTSGSDITFVLSASAPMEATVAARSDTANRDIMIFAAVVCLGALIYMSFATNHSWIQLLRTRIQKRGAVSGEVAPSNA